MSHNLPPIDIYEEIIVEDVKKDYYGFFAEGVKNTEGKWIELGININGDYLWAWSSVDKNIKYKQYKGWVVSGNKPVFINNKWLVMGFEPSIFFAYFGEITQNRIKIKNNIFYVNNDIKISAELVNINEIIDETNLNNNSFIINDSQINRLIEQKEADINIQLKFFFPIIELSDFLMQKYTSINSLNKFIKRTKYFLSINPVKHYIFKIINNKIQTLNKLPIEDKDKLVIADIVFNNSVKHDEVYIYTKNLKTLYFGIAFFFPNRVNSQDKNELQKQLSNIEIFILSILETL